MSFSFLFSILLPSRIFLEWFLEICNEILLRVWITYDKRVSFSHDLNLHGSDALNSPLLHLAELYTQTIAMLCNSLLSMDWYHLVKDTMESESDVTISRIDSMMFIMLILILSRNYRAPKTLHSFNSLMCDQRIHTMIYVYIVTIVQSLIGTRIGWSHVLWIIISNTFDFRFEFSRLLLWISSRLHCREEERIESVFHL